MLVFLFDIDKLKNYLKELEDVINEPDFWSNQENANKITTEMKRIQKKLDHFFEIEKELKNIEELNNMLIEEYDNESAIEVLKETRKIEKKIKKMEMEVLFSGKYDQNNAIITLHPGAGGTESQDWVQMLYRMYVKWASSNSFKVKELDYLEGDEAGIKSVTFLVSGDYAYGNLKGEMGVHRLVRISPFDAGGRRHTSFASVEVLPEITDDIQIDIKAEDLRIDTYRASGAGGQHINKTDSAIRITHLPTNIVVSCQSERSQIQNRETAMKMLKSKLFDLKEKENKEKIEDLKGVQRDIAWGSQIRSYVFHPYNMVKDHRTGYGTANTSGVMDGDINEFILEYLKMSARKEIGH